jgi:hypothetical protein
MGKRSRRDIFLVDIYVVLRPSEAVRPRGGI